MTQELPSEIASEVGGLTLAGFAQRLGQHPQHARPAYNRFMRLGEGLDLPAITRQSQADGLIKFCLPVGTDAQGRTLETESVIIPMHGHHGQTWYTLCVSSQVGCRMGCTFCETGRMGLIRQLTAAEIVQQRLVARQIRHQLQPLTGPANYFQDGIQNIVFMGMGEPLDNFDALRQAIEVLSDPAGLSFPHSQITVSTVGRIDGIRRLAALGWINLRLAISLNAARDDLRNELMPINRGMPLAELQKTLLEYPLPRKGRFLIEYVLIRDVNDSPEDADRVVEWCRPLPCVVNLIPYNPQSDSVYQSPPDERVWGFLMRLRAQGIFSKRRVTHGRDLMGACGQLGNPTIQRQRLVSIERQL